MNRFRSISPRRRMVFALVLAMLALIAALSWMGVAGFRGTQATDMDWNADGQVSRGEILQGYTVIVVREAAQGNRSCRSYARMRDRENPIRVDCRTEAAPVATPAE